jgi:hypothetical protein
MKDLNTMLKVEENWISFVSQFCSKQVTDNSIHGMLLSAMYNLFYMIGDTWLIIAYHVCYYQSLVCHKLH